MMSHLSEDQLKKAAAGIADITFTLLTSCQEKEERFAKRLGLTRPEFRCLRSFRNENRISIKIIIERLNISGSRLTRILDDLEQKKLLTRDFDPDDRRSIMVKLTETGSALVSNMESTYIDIHKEILADIPVEMHEPLLKGMQKLSSSLNEWLKSS